jgi:citrate synthase
VDGIELDSYYLPPPEAEMIVMDGQEFLTAQEACAILSIKPATLYSYVSRGLLSSYRQGIKRTRLYRRDEVDSLMRLRGPDERDDGASGDEDGHAWIPYV